MRIFAQRNVTLVKPAGWQIRKLFPGAPRWRAHDSVARSEAEAGSVRLIEPARRAPATAVERHLVGLLKNEGIISYDRLVQRVAEEIYHEELRLGAGAVDIGLFGSRLFDRDVVSALKVGDGMLWKISWGEGKV